MLGVGRSRRFTGPSYALWENQRDFGAPALPFLIAQICPRIIELDTLRHRHPCREPVRESQEAVAQADPYVALIPTDDLPESDNLHFDTAGLIVLGRRYARAYVQLA